ncbi:DUF4232 domain-containing protein [Streptomyces sp. TRM68416]|uniref:DUF4232 domain-containing protein n=1 Tax=Streptomyces sp. TRM68416 TaxID=2758412 RepID=UPI00166210B4|nr:DUF4232 domain-containing protein [Streptomyces sp. TRM68416]MBD0841430.1 DUF4232 domain-containing protein [Streptomyces sp. TRM68416]
MTTDADRRTVRPAGRRSAPPRSAGLPRTGAVLGAVVLGAATACGGGGSEPPPPSTPVSSTVEPTSATTAATTPGDGSASPSVSPARCTRDRLDLSLGRVSPGAGSRYAPLVFTNTGTRPCSLHGYPGVTLLDSAGDRIGQPAERQGPAAPPVILHPGDSAHAALHTVAPGLTDKPCWRPAARIQAYPPGSTWALRTSADSFRVCGGVFEVRAVEPGTHP